LEDAHGVAKVEILAVLHGEELFYFSSEAFKSEAQGLCLLGTDL
jgi:hypothetical protein